MNVIFFTSCTVLCVIPVWFVVNKVYEDGLVGRISLLGISFAAVTFLLENFFGDDNYEILPQTVMLVTFFAVFLCWHLFRFHRRILKQRLGMMGQQGSKET